MLSEKTAWVVALSGGAFLRFCILAAGLNSAWGDYIAFVTPITNFKRVVEGIYLYDNKLDPYAGSALHQGPLVLAVFRWIRGLGSDSLVDLVFVLGDLLAAAYLTQLGLFVRRDSAGAEAGALRKHLPLAIAGLYLFNPLTILTCGARSLSAFSTLATFATLAYAVRGSAKLATLCLALAIYQSVYPAVLLAPVILLLQQRGYSAGRVVALVVGWAAVLLALSRAYSGSWDFVRETFGFTLLVPDMTPNVGLFWYFFTEMFEHFRAFFVCVLQGHAFMYVIPLTIRLRDSPLFLAVILLAIIGTFKSYPQVGDTACYLALLPLFDDIVPHMRYGHLIVLMFVFVAMLLPALWFLWIYQGTGNSNFFFNACLFFGTLQVWLILDLVYAHLKLDHVRRTLKTEKKAL